MDDLKKTEDTSGTGERGFTGGDTRIVDGEQPVVVVEEEITVRTFTGGDTR